MEADLTLGRMDVAIEGERVDFNPENSKRMPAPGHRFRIGLAKGLVDFRTLDDAAIQDHILLLAVRAPLTRARKES